MKLKPNLCSIVHLRRVKAILEKRDKYSGELDALMRCSAKSTFSDWRRAIEVLETVRLSELDHIQATHLREINRRSEESDWQLWVDKCEENKWTVKELRQEIELTRQGEPIDSSEIELETSPLNEFLVRQKNIDAIITDPPYNAKSISLYGDLARLAKPALAERGVLAVMCGQSHLPQILNEMTPHMPYRWTMAYLTPGGQAPQIWNRKVNTFWKPILLFGASPAWIGDVIRSDVNDNDKRFHSWGQAEVGMSRLVEALTDPGDLVCDPFLGGGTTAVVCAKMGRRFIGADKEKDAIATTKRRLDGLGGFDKGDGAKPYPLPDFDGMVMK